MIAPLGLSQVAYNAIQDETYNPYCMRCVGLIRMKRIEPFFWGCFCGARCDERAEVATYQAALAAQAAQAERTP